MATKRRRFTAEFKARVAMEALRGDRTIQEIAAKHQAHPSPGVRLEAASPWPEGAVRASIYGDLFAPALSLACRGRCYGVTQDMQE